MKNINIIKFLIAGLLGFTSCSIDNVEPSNLLLEDNVISNESTALNVLNRIYNSGLRSNFYGAAGGSGDFVTELSMAGLDTEVLAASPTLTQYYNNTPQSTDGILQLVYETSYFNISNCNYFIELVERGDAKVSETRKNELIAEAKFFRGLTHFNLLKVFGQFYDLNSDLGVVVITEPIRGNIEFPRNTVKETYDAIISDLQFAADYGVGNREHYYVSATTARAQLAKVQLYMGDYTNSASNALDVINNTDNYILESDYKTVFADRWGPETLLAAFVDVTTEGAQAERFRRDVVGPSTILANLADAQDGVVGNGSSDYETGYDPRLKVGFYQDPTAGTFYIGKYPIPSNFGNANEGNAIKVLRMSEMYLIYAEAEARRQGGDLTEALNKLNAIRNRVNITPKILSDKATLLEDIRLEKLLELYCETGESWFDLVRYDRLGDITASTIKATVSSVDKLIFPLPNNALLGNKLLVPNP